jgi:hypothetical protein
VQFEIGKFLIKRQKVKIQPEGADVTPNFVARFTRTDEPAAKKLPAAAI